MLDFRIELQRYCISRSLKNVKHLHELEDLSQNLSAQKVQILLPFIMKPLGGHDGPRGSPLAYLE